MTTFGVDYSFARPSVAALKAAGVKFAARYLSHTESKNLTASEARALLAAGIAIVVVWEDGAKRADAGKAAGIADAKAAEALRKSIGMPAGQVLHFAIDYDATVGPNIRAYFEGVASVIGLARTGVYGGYKVVKALFDDKLISHAWQTYAWSNGDWDKRAQIQQYSNGHTIDGGGVDYDRATVASYGQWAPPPPVPPKAGGAPIPSPKLPVDGKFTPAVVRALQRALRYRQKSTLPASGVLDTATAKALQRYVKVTADGKLGVNSIKALQRKVGATADGKLGPNTVKALEKKLNAGTF